MLRITGELLTVDVGERTWETTRIDDELRSFIGGRGVAVKLAHDRIPFDADPLGAANRVYLSTGPLQASRMSFTGRMNATAVSPLTDGLVSTNAGGFLSRNFVEAGYPCVEIVGESDELLAVHVTDEEVTFESVPELAGATVSETSAAMTERHGFGGDHLVTVGPAGENRVRYAALMTSDSRAFGRGGLGAVLGAKNVKTVSFTGDAEVDVSLPDGDVADEIHRQAATEDHIMKRQGTTSGVDLKNELFSLPTKYFERMSFDEGVEGINGAAVESKKYRRGTCSMCAFACKLPTRDEARGVETEGPEYETVFSFGSNLLVDDVVSVMKSNELCDELGLDTISAGVTIGAYLASEERFGDSTLIHDLVEKIARREGVGDLLAEGVDRAHETLGVTNWTSKGLEFPGHDGRVLHGRALGYATSNRGADHMYSKIHNLEYEGRIHPEGLDGKASIVADLEDLKAVNDSAVICKFSRGAMSDERYERLFGTEYDRLLERGRAVVELERHFNNQRGFDRSDDVLPYEIDGLERALDEYYAYRGWTADGVVPDENVV
ncbi:aldehyde ferredoxin oxidoreductase [Salinigranum rubrum]|uniref:Aldehyde ferredoxin oxidoreductase n=1 Tax=Salinigranum rubrum TaxID=755307 RepID=A0A2I8VFY6_9EURY|nr:aldehyde ferredoxin oxidoreductase C-terminal domain-containing protein [Salinigranum rubrum]AUV80784.1 aldehyde ferredoxin oxidoreductase [Salinigranum rubrum]